MAIDVPTFLASFPEFNDAPAALISAKLAEAALMCPDTVWGQGTASPGGGGGSLTQRGTFLHCARFLALSPYARKMQLASKDGRTIYDGEIRTLQLTVTSGFRVT